MVNAGHTLICLALWLSGSLVICDSPCDFQTTDNTILYEQLALRASDVVVSLLSIIQPLVGVISPMYWSILDIQIAASPKDNLATCIEEEIKKKMDSLSELRVMSKIHGFQSTFNGLCTGQDIEVCTKNYTEKMSTTSDNNIWLAVTLLATRMKETAADFRIAKHEYQSPLYFYLPEYATQHFAVYQMIIALSKKMNRTSVERNKYKELMVKMIQYYSEVVFRYYIQARDNKCGWNKCYEDAPFFIFIGKWKELAKAIQTKSSNNVVNYIEKSLESLKVKTGQEVAFRSTRHLTGYERQDEYWVNYLSTNSGYGWLSCGTKGAWCYLRDCPGEYVNEKSADACGGEKFIIRHSGIVHQNDPIGLEFRNGYWLSFYLTKWCMLGPEICHTLSQKCRPPQVVCNPSWWATTSCPYDQEGCDREQLKLSKLGGSPGSLIRNGDIVDIWWDGNLTKGSGQWFTRKTPVFQGPFQIVRVSNQPETNRWKETPGLPDG